jgi:transcriptional regulator with XRE-family HTH domain
MERRFDEAAASRRIFEAVPRQVDLARRLGLTSAAISNLKKRQKVTLGLLIAAAELTGESVEWFLFGTKGGGSGATAERIATLSEATTNASEKARRLVEKLKTPANAEDSEHVRRLLKLHEQRSAALEEWVRILDARITVLERKS